MPANPEDFDTSDSKLTLAKQLAGLAWRSNSRGQPHDRFTPEPIDEPNATSDLFGGPVKRTKAAKRVFNITLAGPTGMPFAFAGLWDHWKQSDGRYLESFAIVTTEPNELVSTIHDRLALILKPRDYDRWLTSDDKEDPRLPLDLLHPLDWDDMKMVPANPAVGNWRNNGPEMLNDAYTN